MNSVIFTESLRPLFSCTAWTKYAKGWAHFSHWWLGKQGRWSCPHLHCKQELYLVQCSGLGLIQIPCTKLSLGSCPTLHDVKPLCCRRRTSLCLLSFAWNTILDASKKHYTDSGTLMGFDQRKRNPSGHGGPNGLESGFKTSLNFIFKIQGPCRALCYCKVSLPLHNAKSPFV